MDNNNQINVQDIMKEIKKEIEITAKIIEKT